MAPKKAIVKSTPKGSSVASVLKVKKMKSISPLASKAACLKAKADQDKLKAKSKDAAMAAALKEKAKAAALKEKEQARKMKEAGAIQKEREREFMREEAEKRKAEALEAKEMEDAIAQVAKFEAEEAARSAKRQCLETSKTKDKTETSKTKDKTETSKTKDKLVEEQDEETNEDEQAIDEWEVVFAGSINVRAAADQNARILGKKASGTIVRASQSGDWVALKDEPGFMLFRMGDIVAMEKKALLPAIEEEDEEEEEEEEEEKQEEKEEKEQKDEVNPKEKDETDSQLVESQGGDEEVIKASQGSDVVDAITAVDGQEIVEQNMEVSEGVPSQNDDSTEACKKIPDPKPNDSGDASAVEQLPSATAKDMWKRRAKVFQDKIKMGAATNMWSLLPDMPGASPAVTSNTLATSVVDGGDASTHDENGASKEEPDADAKDVAKDDNQVKQIVEKPLEPLELEPLVFARNTTVQSGEDKEKRAAAVTKTNATESHQAKADEVDMWSLLPDVK